MGNWRTVNLIGTVGEDDVPALRAAIDPGVDYRSFHPLVDTKGLCGLGMWVHQIINARGNLAERDYTVEDIARTLRRLLGVAPSLVLIVHCGGDYEDETCVATITVMDGEVTVGEPQVKTVDGMSEVNIMANVYRALYR